MLIFADICRLFLIHEISNTLHPQILKSWEQFYPKEDYLPYNEYRFNDTLTSQYTLQHDDGQLYIFGCSFENITTGAIRYSSKEASLMLIEHCFFTQCISTYYGGAIFFSQSGQCVLSSVCSVKCQTQEGYMYGQFCYITTSSRAGIKNYIMESTISLTKNRAYETLYQTNGDIKCDTLNVSYNEVTQISAIYCYNPSPEATISYSTIRNNTAYNDRCILCNQLSHVIKNTNVIENKCYYESPYSYGIIHAFSASVNLIHCSIFGNKANNGFLLFSEGQGTIHCTFCSIVSENQTISSGDVDFTEIPETFFINSHDFLQFGDCQAAPESWSSVFPVSPNQTPQNTPPQTPEMTCAPTATIPAWLKESLKRQKNPKSIYNTKENNLKLVKDRPSLGLIKIIPNNEQADFISLEKKSNILLIRSDVLLVILSSLSTTLNK